LFKPWNSDLTINRGDSAGLSFTHKFIKGGENEINDIRCGQACVTVDDFLGGYQVTRHLLDLGHQNVAVFAEKTRSSKERIRGFKKAVEEAGIRFQDRMVFFCDTSVDGGKFRRSTKSLPTPPR
jgi:DNA-binding LacI/PurR family transcriptional regulator